MAPDKHRFYALLGTVWTAGLAWLIYVLKFSTHAHESIGVCFLKGVTGFPCPSCGSTRSVVYLLQGEFMLAIKMNPLGIFITLLLLAVPLWIAYDLITRRSSLWHTFTQTERVIARRAVAIPAGVLIVLNWIWNINKGL